MAGVAIAGIRALPVLELPEVGVGKVFKEDPVAGDVVVTVTRFPDHVGMEAREGWNR